MTLIIPYSYMSIGASYIAKKNMKFRKPPIAYLPRYFDDVSHAKNIKSVPRFHRYEHIPCYCRRRIFPPNDELNLLPGSIVLLITKIYPWRNKRDKVDFYLIGYFRIKSYTTDENICIDCPKFNDKKCKKRRLKVLMDEVAILKDDPLKLNTEHFKSLGLNLGNYRKPFACIFNQLGYRKIKENQEKLRNLYGELVKERPTRTLPKEWQNLIKELIRKIKEHDMYILNELRKREEVIKRWKFASIYNELKI